MGKGYQEAKVLVVEAMGRHGTAGHFVSFM